MILPWIALAFLFAALYARLTRASMLETMGEDFIRTARAKGLPRRTVVVKHGLRAALTPIVTIFGIDLGQLIGTTVITETVFNLRGLGWLSVTSIRQHDLPVIMGVTLVAAFALVIANLIVDILYAFVDPRVRLTPDDQTDEENWLCNRTGHRRAPRDRGSVGVPVRARPACALPHRRRSGQVGRRPVVRPRSWRDPRHRRRVGLGQVGDEPGHPRPAQGLVGGGLRRDLVRRQGARPHARRRHAGAARQRDGDDLPGSAVVAAPVLHHRRADRRGVPGAQQGEQGRRAQARGRDAGTGRHPQPRQAFRRLPAPVLGRYAPARDDRDGAGLRPEAAHRRRADDRARRDRPGADPRADEGPAARVQLGDHPHHSRPGRRGRDLRDVVVMYGGQCVEQGSVRRHLLQPADALHLGPARLDAADGPHPASAAHPDPGHAAVADPGAARLCVPPALPLPRSGRRGGVHDGAPRPRGRRQHRPPRALPHPKEHQRSQIFSTRSRLPSS